MIVISAQTFPPKSGGIEALMSGLASECVAAGYEVLVLADGRRGDDNLQPYKIERFRGPRPLRQRLKALRLRHLAKSGKVEAIYTCSWKSVEAIGRKLRCPVVTFGHGNEFKASKSDRIHTALQWASALICVSDETRRRADGMIPEGTTVQVINPPVQEPAPSSKDDRDWAEKQFGSSSARILSLSRLIPLKGHDQTIRAIAELVPEFPGIKLVIAGDGEDHARLSKLAEDLGVRDHVVFTGRVEGGRKTALFESANLFAQPGRQIGQEREGFGITYLEAALHGLASITGNQGGAPEAVISDKTGYIVDGNSLDEIVEAFRKILSDNSNAQKFSNAAREHGKAALWKNKIGEILAVAGLQARRDVSLEVGRNDPFKGKDT